MTIGAIFGGAGFVAGLFLRAVPFAIFLLVAVAGYAGMGLGRETSISVLTFDMLIALVSGQVGYFLAVLLRIATKKREAMAETSAAEQTETKQPGIAGSGGGKSIPR
jgi:hypothetical protein